MMTIVGCWFVNKDFSCLELVYTRHCWGVRGGLVWPPMQLMRRICRGICLKWCGYKLIEDHWAFLVWLIVKCTKMHERMREKMRLPVMDVNNSLGNLQDVNSRHVNSVFNKRWDVQLSWAFALTRVWGSFTCLGSFRSLHQFTRGRQIVDTLHLANTSRKRQTNTQTETNKKHKNYFTAEGSHWFTRKWLHTNDVAPHVLVPPPSTIKLAKLYDS